MAAYCPAAVGAFPFLGLPFEQFLDAMVPGELQVFNHAHPKLLAVTGIEVLEVLTGEVGALVAVFHLAFHQQFTALFQEGASFIPGPATAAIRHSDSLVSNIIGERKVATAGGTVHTTGSNQIFVHFHATEYIRIKRKRSTKGRSNLVGEMVTRRVGIVILPCHADSTYRAPGTLAPSMLSSMSFLRKQEQIY